MSVERIDTRFIEVPPEPGDPELEFRKSNVVVTCSVLMTEGLWRALPDIFYTAQLNPQKFSTIQVRTSFPAKATVLFFSTGVINCTGSANKWFAYYVLQHIVATLTRYTKCRMLSEPIRIANEVGGVQLPYRIKLGKLKRRFPGIVQYTKTKFPCLHMSSFAPWPMISCLIAKSGYINCIGYTDETIVRLWIRLLERLVLRYFKKGAFMDMSEHKIEKCYSKQLLSDYKHIRCRTVWRVPVKPYYLLAVRNHEKTKYTFVHVPFNYMDSIPLADVLKQRDTTDHDAPEFNQYLENMGKSLDTGVIF